MTETTEVWEKRQETTPARKKNGVQREEKKPMKQHKTTQMEPQEFEDQTRKLLLVLDFQQLLGRLKVS